MPSFDDLCDSMDRIIMDRLGEAVTFSPDGGESVTLMADVYYPEAMQALSVGHMIEQSIHLEILISDAPEGISERDMFSNLRRSPGVAYYARNPTRNRSGSHWIINLVEAR